MFSLLAICLAFIFHAAATAHETESLDVIILGGGAAGIKAAATLESEGITNYKIIEASDRVGGILRAAMINETMVEVGPMRLWTGDTELVQMMDDLDIDYIEYLNRFEKAYTETGEDVTKGAQEYHTMFREVTANLADHIQNQLDHDLPEISAYNTYESTGFDLENPFIGFVNIKTFSLADPKLASLKYKTSKSGTQMIVVEQEDIGFASFLNRYAMQEIQDYDTKLMLNAEVTSIEHTMDNVTVHSGDMHYTAKKLIVAYSLGELKHNVMKFMPPLPTWKTQAIFGYESMQYINFYLRFELGADEDWIVPGNTVRMSYISHRIAFYPLFNDASKWHNGSMLIRGIAIREEATRLRAMTDEDIMAEIMGVLRTMFGADIPDAVEILVPRDGDDPIRYGAYSFWPAGYTMAQHMALKAATGRVHYAGDYVMGKTESYLKADWLAGEMVAKEVAMCMMDMSDMEKCGGFKPSYLSRGCMYKDAHNYNSNAKEDDGSCILYIKPPKPSASVPLRSGAAVLISVLSAFMIFHF